MWLRALCESPPLFPRVRWIRTSIPVVPSPTSFVEHVPCFTVDSSVARERRMRQHEVAMACSQLSHIGAQCPPVTAPWCILHPCAAGGHGKAPVQCVVSARAGCSKASACPVPCIGDRSAETLDLVPQSCMQKASCSARTTAGCPERGCALEKALALLCLALLLAWMLAHDHICAVFNSSGLRGILL